MSSARERAGSAGFTTRILACEPINPIGAKSACASKLIFLYSAALVARMALLPLRSV
jgi:hypothetical protein